MCYDGKGRGWYWDWETISREEHVSRDFSDISHEDEVVMWIAEECVEVC